MTTQGAFVWYDLMTTDTGAAQAFYSSVIGWEAEDSQTPGMTYTLLKVEGRPAAGLMDLPQEALAAGVPPCWTGYVAVDDVDAMAQAFVADAGAVRRPPEDIPGVGRFAVVADPQGAVLCLFKGQGEPPAALPPQTPGLVSWHELITSDPEAAFAFYAKHFGWTKGDAMNMGEMGTYQIVMRGDVAVGGMMRQPPQVTARYWGFYFNVTDINAAIDRVNAGGGTILHGPVQVPGGSWIAQARDPQGAFFAMVAP
jgi:hypothetical protein